MIPAGIMTPNLDNALLTWARKCAVAPDSLYLLVHNDFIAEARMSGWWDTLHGIRLLNAPSDGYLINLKNPNERMTEYGNGIQKDYYGWQGDGATAYLDTGKTASQLGMSASPVSISTFVFSLSDYSGIYGASGASGGVNTGAIRLRSGGVWGFWLSSAYQVQLPSQNAIGLSGIVGNNVNGGFAVRNGTTTTILSPVSTLATSTFRYGRTGVSGTYDINQLAYGFDGPAITTDQAASIYLATTRALTTLINYRPATEQIVPISKNNCFTRDCRVGVPGVYTGSIGRILNPPLSNTQENIARYTATTRNINWVDNSYTTDINDLNVTLYATAGSVNKTVNLVSAIGQNNKLQVVRKMDNGTGTINVNGTVLTKIYDVAIFVSDNTDWILTQDYQPIEASYPFFPADEYCIRPWGTAVRSSQTQTKLSEFVWMARGLGATEGEITAWAKKPNDTMGGITLSSGIQARTEFNTYELAMGETWAKIAFSLGYEPRNDTTLTTFDNTYRAEGWGWLDICDYAGYDTYGWNSFVNGIAISNIANNGTLVRVTTATPHGMLTDQPVVIIGVLGVQGANGTYNITRINDNTFDLQSSTFISGSSYISGGLAYNGTVDTGPVAHRAWFNYARDSIFTQNAVSGQFKVARDKIILGQGRLADIKANDIQPVWGIRLDTEAADKRTPEQFVRTMRGIARLCHAKNYSFGSLSHHIDGGTGSYSGWRKSNANALFTAPNGVDGINENIDRLVLVTESTSASAEAMIAKIQSQMDFLRGEAGDLPIPYDKLEIELRVGGPGVEMSESYVDALKVFRDSHPFAGSWITPLYAQFGGEIARIPNQRLARFIGLAQS